MEPSALPPDRIRVAVFAKAPIPGSVKTRLAPRLGPEGAARLHARLVHHALAAALESGVDAVELWCAPSTDDPFFADCARRFGVRLRAQHGADLGARMHDAFETVAREGAKLIVVGCDCPALGGEGIRAAASALATNDAVFAPAEDGGYGLVALARPCAVLFAGIEWGGDAVMAGTRARLREQGLAWHELPPTWDVDRPEDYDRLEREGLLREVLA